MNLLDVLLKILIWDESSFPDHQLVQKTLPSNHCTACLIENPQLLQNRHSWTKIEMNLHFMINYNLYVIILCYNYKKSKLFKKGETLSRTKFPAIAASLHLWTLRSYYKFLSTILAIIYNTNFIKQKKNCFSSLNKQIYKTIYTQNTQIPWCSISIDRRILQNFINSCLFVTHSTGKNQIKLHSAALIAFKQTRYYSK